MHESDKQLIKKLFEEGNGYRKISRITNISYTTVVYHLNDKFRQSLLDKSKKFHPFKIKLGTFLYDKHKPKQLTPKQLGEWKALIRSKVQNFHPKGTPSNQMLFTYQEVIEKFGENVQCYLTGDDINVLQPRTYNFDHIIPSSRGGQSTLDNLGICTKEANQAKSDKTPDEFFNFCKKILEHNGYKVQKL